MNMKTDDNVFVFIPCVLQVSGNVKRPNMVVYGHCCHNRSPARTSPDKFYTPYWMYPEATYPQYCHGSGYILSA